MASVMSGSVRTAVHIRWMIRRDFPEVLAIEAAGFDDPWTEDDFLRVLRHRNCIGMVAELGERVIGFIIYELDKSHLTLLDLAVHQDYRRQDVGRQLVAKLLGKLSAHRRTRLIVPVHEGNLVGHLFLRSCGLKVTRVERDAYENGDSDYVFEYSADGGSGSTDGK